MTHKQEAPAENGQGAENLNKDTDFAEDTQLLEQVEVVIPDNSKLDTTLTLPTWGLPHLEDGIFHISDIYGCSPDYVVMGQMTAVSSAIGKNIMSYDGKFYNYGMAWNMLVGRQGTSKSEPLKQALQPLLDINNEMYQEYKRQKDIWVEGEIKPIYSPSIVADTTPEYLYDLMGRGGAVTCFYDEIANLEENRNRYNTGGDSTTLLSISSGSQISVNRKNGEPIVIPNPFLNITGTIQPETLVRIYGKEAYINNGYLARWLFAFPENQAIQMYNENTVDKAVLKRYDSFIRYIATANSLGIVPFTPGAKKLYTDYFNMLQTKKMNAADGYEAGIYSKLQIHAQRWALTTFTARLFELNEKMQISDEVMRYSIDCMQYFEYTALKVRDLIYRNRNLRNQPREIGKSDILREFVKVYPNAGKDKTALAKVMGVSRSQVSRELNRPL